MAKKKQETRAQKKRRLERQRQREMKRRPDLAHRSSDPLHSPSRRSSVATFASKHTRTFAVVLGMILLLVLAAFIALGGGSGASPEQSAGGPQFELTPLDPLSAEPPGSPIYLPDGTPINPVTGLPFTEPEVRSPSGKNPDRKSKP